MNSDTHQIQDLTKNQRLVFEVLRNRTGPLTAYAILDELKQTEMRAPLQVYRALDKLIVLGLAHRVESLNSFVACRHPGCETHATSAFSICEKCGDVREYTDLRLDGLLATLANANGFILENGTIELRGCCENCPQGRDGQ